MIAIMNLWILLCAQISLLSEEPLASQEGLCPMELVIIPGFTACVTHKLYLNVCGLKSYSLFQSSDC